MKLDGARVGAPGSGASHWKRYHVKSSDSSDEEHGLAGDVRTETGRSGMAPVLSPGGTERSQSGVVAAPSDRGAPGRDLSDSDDADEDTRVGPGTVPRPMEQQDALARRIRDALGQTLPLGTP